MRGIDKKAGLKNISLKAGRQLKATRRTISRLCGLSPIRPRFARRFARFAPGDRLDAMTIRRKPVDVAVIGLGAAGGVAVLPLARAGLKVAGIEAGGWMDSCISFKP